MTSSARDIRYGRRGGGWIDGPAPSPPVPCDVCGTPVHVGTRHVQCAPDAQNATTPTLFDDANADANAS